MDVWPHWFYITSKDYDRQEEIIVGHIYWNDSQIEKWGFAPICVVNGHSFGVNSKPYRKIKFTF
jgi:hypothetical protein